MIVFFACSDTEPRRAIILGSKKRLRVSIFECLNQRCASYAIRIGLFGRVGAFGATNVWEQAAFLSDACGSI